MSLRSIAKSVTDTTSAREILQLLAMHKAAQLLEHKPATATTFTFRGSPNYNQYIVAFLLGFPYDKISPDFDGLSQFRNQATVPAPVTVDRKGRLHNPKNGKFLPGNTPITGSDFAGSEYGFGKVLAALKTQPARQAGKTAAQLELLESARAAGVQVLAVGTAHAKAAPEPELSRRRMPNRAALLTLRTEAREAAVKAVDAVFARAGV